MTPAELLQLLQARGIPARTRGTEVQVEVCWSCSNDRWNLELSTAKGVYHCWSCRASGRLDVLLRDRASLDVEISVSLGEGGARGLLPVAADFQASPVREVGSAVAYLARRGVSLPEAEAAGLIICTEQGHRLYGRICFPVREYWSHQVVGHTGRSYTGTIPKYLTTVPETLVGGIRRRDRDGPRILVEGPFDALAVAAAGFDVAYLSGTGGGAAVRWAERLPPDVPLVFLLDGSAAEEARKLYWAIQPVHARALILSLPEGTDPATFRPEVLRALIQHRVSAGS